MGERRGRRIYRGEGGKWRVAVGERRTPAFNPIKRINGVGFFSIALMESKWERKKKQSREELLNVMDERTVGQARGRGRSGALGSGARGCRERAGAAAWARSLGAAASAWARGMAGAGRAASGVQGRASRLGGGEWREREE
jgi:hypothetical protein